MIFKTNITNSSCKDLNDSRDMQNGYSKATPSCHCYDYNHKVYVVMTRGRIWSFLDDKLVYFK